MILIVDFGSQLAHLIGRRLREIGVSYEICDPENSQELLETEKYAGVILSGGPSSVYEDDAPVISEHIYTLGLPILGICYGWQLMAHQLAGKVKGGFKEYGPELIKWRNGFEKVAKLPQSEHQVFMSHGDSVVELPDGFEVVGSTKNLEFAAVFNEEKKMLGIQFHPEAEHTQYGLELLKHFAHNLCGEKIVPFKLDPSEIIADIRHKVGEKKVICAVSGGVDSTVAAFLIGKAIGQNLIPVYVESGLMRPGTAAWVKKIFTQHIDAKLVIVKAEDRFIKALAGKEDPEEKRKIVGKLYVEIFQEVACEHPEVEFLGQGTIYSDVIESQGSKRASHIKSHHNAGGLPEKLGFKLLEPVRNYYKDEVRAIGEMLSLPEEVVMAQPFPGPGYAVRIRGEVTPKRLQQAKLADKIIMEEMKKAGLWQRAFQSFPVMTGAYSTAVKGDVRAFAEVVALRVYESKDIMTAGWMHIPYGVLQNISSRVVNEVPDVSRVVYDITTKPPATMEWE